MRDAESVATILVLENFHISIQCRRIRESRNDRPVKPIEVNPELQARGHVMTPAERRAQRISFAYGNIALSNADVTREMVEQAAEELDQQDERRKEGEGNG